MNNHCYVCGKEMVSSEDDYIEGICGRCKMSQENWNDLMTNHVPPEVDESKFDTSTAVGSDVNLNCKDKYNLIESNENEPG